MKNLERYDRVRSVPEKAKRKIGAGRLKGFTDINPMWRIKVLTEEYGEVGVGWYTKIERTWIDEGAGGEKVANIIISLYTVTDGTPSAPITGVGGSYLVSKEKNGLYTDDECWKKAYTDALSVACKAIGIGADVYYEKDASGKYGEPEAPEGQPAPPVGKKPPEGGKGQQKSKFAQINDLIKDSSITIDTITDWIVQASGKNIRINDLNDEQFAWLVKQIKAELGR